MNASLFSPLHHDQRFICCFIFSHSRGVSSKQLGLKSQVKQASRMIRDWIRFYNDQRSHLALAMKTPAEAFALAASPVLWLGYYTTAQISQLSTHRPGTRSNSRRLLVMTQSPLERA
ncbi:MAG: integrase core domain-containing protein [Lautropia sp.]|nr:integrase core domain-containing protein [Lautropia sp.]